MQTALHQNHSVPDPHAQTGPQETVSTVTVMHSAAEHCITHHLGSTEQEEGRSEHTIKHPNVISILF